MRVLPVISLLLLVASMAAAQARPNPRLEVLIVVDQLRPDYFDRFGGQFSGGLHRLGTQGTFYTNAWQDHAITETAPGHSTVLSGRSPASTGIVTNTLGVIDSGTKLVGTDGVPGASPTRFRGTTLLDWLVRRDSATRSLSVSRKDRGAILPLGRAGSNVYWYANGWIRTSTWYSDTLPAWLVAWNGRRGVARLAGTQWDLLRDAASYREPDSMPYENYGRDFVFPHSLPADTATMERRAQYYPWMDSLTLDVALEGARHLQLGRRAGTDLLVVSLSTTDAIGHDFGPESREQHDQLLRLDKWLGWFMDSLAVLVPREATLYALTADHGVQPFPERTGSGGRVVVRALVQQAGRKLEARYQARFNIDFDTGLVTADVNALKSRGINVDSLADALASLVARHQGVVKTYTPRSLARAPATDEQARLWRRTIPTQQGWLVATVAGPGWLFSQADGWTDHGTTRPVDMHVPIIFFGPGVTARKVARRVTTEDIGPTFAVIAGVRPTEAVTGRPLHEVSGAAK